FWAGKVKDLEAIPANPQVEPVESGKPGVDYFKVRLDNINGTHVYGQLARPKKEGKYPALLVVQWAGVYGLNKDWVVHRADQGWGPQHHAPRPAVRPAGGVLQAGRRH